MSINKYNYNIYCIIIKMGARNGSLPTQWGGTGPLIGPSPLYDTHPKTNIRQWRTVSRCIDIHSIMSRRLWLRTPRSPRPPGTMGNVVNVWRGDTTWRVSDSFVLSCQYSYCLIGPPSVWGRPALNVGTGQKRKCGHWACEVVFSPSWSGEWGHLLRNCSPFWDFLLKQEAVEFRFKFD